MGWDDVRANFGHLSKSVRGLVAEQFLSWAAWMAPDVVYAAIKGVIEEESRPTEPPSEVVVEPFATKSPRAHEMLAQVDRWSPTEARNSMDELPPGVRR